MKRDEFFENFGTVSEIAEYCGVSRSAVCMWFAPREKNGLGGKIPYKHAKKLQELCPMFDIETIMGINND